MEILADALLLFLADVQDGPFELFALTNLVAEGMVHRSQFSVGLVQRFFDVLASCDFLLKALLVAVNARLLWKGPQTRRLWTLEFAD